MTSWFDQAREIPARQVAEMLGCFSFHGKRMWPCPACQESRRSSDDRSKGPVQVGDGWRCYRCGKKGRSLDLVARSMGIEEPGREDWPKIRARFIEMGFPMNEHDPDSWGFGEVAPLQQAAPEPPPDRNPLREVEALWDACQPVFTIPSTLRWCHARRFQDGWRIAALDLARALAPSTPLPTWATCLKRSWWEGGWRLVLPLYNAVGLLEGVRARWVGTTWDEGLQEWKETPPPAKRKSVAAAGASTKGLLLADPVGQWLLGQGRQAMVGGQPDPSAQDLRWNGRVWILEGDVDFLRWATIEGRLSSFDGWPHTTYAVLGYAEGSWNDEMAGRMPRWAHVRIVPHIDPDGKGMALAEVIRKSLEGRVASVTIVNLDVDDATEGRPDGP